MKITFFSILTSFLAASVQASDCDFSADKLNSRLTCKVFVNSLPKADLEIHITGKEPVQTSRIVKISNERVRVELAWNGYFESYPCNPELRIQVLSDQDNIMLEAYKNFDLHARETNQIKSENDDNLGLRTAKDTIYLSCQYLRIVENSTCGN